MPKKTNCNWASIKEIRELKPLPRTRLCGKPDAEIITAIKHMEHHGKVDDAKDLRKC